MAFELPRAKNIHVDFVTRTTSRKLHAEEFRFCATLATSKLPYVEGFQIKFQIKLTHVKDIEIAPCGRDLNCPGRTFKTRHTEDFNFTPRRGRLSTCPTKRNFIILRRFDNPNCLVWRAFRSSHEDDFEIIPCVGRLVFETRTSWKHSRAEDLTLYASRRTCELPPKKVFQIFFSKGTFELPLVDDIQITQE